MVAVKEHKSNCNMNEKEVSKLVSISKTSMQVKLQRIDKEVSTMLNKLQLLLCESATI
jgi:hypothetical protein